jgi:hypothetical protein
VSYCAQADSERTQDAQALLRIKQLLLTSMD